MGCDIHLYKEKFVDGKWITADVWTAYDYGDDDKGIEVPWKDRFTDRNYNLFGVLSKGVRYETPFSFEPRGEPITASHEVTMSCKKWDGDGHSHSYLYLHELKELKLFLESGTIEISGLKDAEGLAALQASIASAEQTDWSLLYPYCQGSSDRTYQEFAVDVPASFIVGEGVDKIINGFDGIEGDNHRIVFWFDN